MRKANSSWELLALIDCEGGPASCWLFLGHVTLNGYGHIRCGNRKTIKAHRWAYEHFYCESPNNLLVLHLCDNRLCCNPNHLKLGTHADNMFDMKTKGRSRRLCYKTIEELKNNGLTQKQIAEHLNCSPNTIYQILRSLRKS